MRKAILWVGVAMILVSCVPYLFPEYTSQIKEPVSLRQAKVNPSRYTGTLVIWGGKIINVTNKRNETYLEILELPLSHGGKPIDNDNSEGRFIAVYKGFLDPAIYSPGRKITLAGHIEETEVITIGETIHTVPRVIVERLHLWEDKVSPYCSVPYHDTECLHRGWCWPYYCW